MCVSLDKLCRLRAVSDRVFCVGGYNGDRGELVKRKSSWPRLFVHSTRLF